MHHLLCLELRLSAERLPLQPLPHEFNQRRDLLREEEVFVFGRRLRAVERAVEAHQVLEPLLRDDLVEANILVVARLDQRADRRRHHASQVG